MLATQCETHDRSVSLVPIKLPPDIPSEKLLTATICVVHIYARRIHDTSMWRVTVMKASERWFRLLLRLYPADFRDESLSSMPIAIARVKP